MEAPPNPKRFTSANRGNTRSRPQNHPGDGFAAGGAQPTLIAAPTQNPDPSDRTGMLRKSAHLGGPQRPETARLPAPAGQRMCEP